ncbi:MAG: sigma-70 family RNA polymerase sigma factor [Gemmataceae bacterium]|nr:sigma-70 family RNA polymerase sigma factor [Gemmataceae bacterium]
MTTSLSRVIEHLHRVAQRDECDGSTDGQLLERFITGRDERAFAALVRRHGAMVLGVCRRFLANDHDAEDAFQAAFLVLARKAASVRPRELVGNWLYGVAYRTALEARAANARRGARERQVEPMPEPAAAERERCLDLQPLLDEELSRLPDRYRVPVVLCELEGRSRKEVAGQLGIPEGTLSSRLAAARKLLAGRLARRGLALSGGALTALLAESASAAVPASLVASTVKAAALVAAGEAAAVGLVSARAAALAKGVMQGMFLSKLKIGAVLFLALGVLGVGIGTVAHRALGADVPAPAVADADDTAAADQDQERPARDGDKPAAKDKRRDGDKPAAKDKRRDGDKPREGNNNLPGDRGKAGVEQVTLTGTVSKEERKAKRDDGSEFTRTHYLLTEARGNKVQLPLPRVTEAGKLLDSYKLTDFVGKQVTITGLAQVIRTGEAADAPRRVVRFRVITEIKEKKK